MAGSFTLRKASLIVAVLVVFGGIAAGVVAKQRQTAREEAVARARYEQHLAEEREKKTRRWAQAAESILRKAETLELNGQRNEIWRAALLDAARESGRPAQELKEDLEAGLAELKAGAPARSNCVDLVIAGDVAFALYRLEEARDYYRLAVAAPNIAEHRGLEAKVQERVVWIVEEGGAAEQVRAHRQFAFAAAENSSEAGVASTAALRLARCYQMLGRTTEMLSVLNLAVAREEKLTGAESVEVIRPLARHCRALVETRQWAAAEPVSRRLLALSEKHFGPEDYRTGLHLLIVADLLAGQRELAEAEKLCARAFAIFEKTSEPAHPAADQALAGRAFHLFNSGRFAEAEELYQRLLEIEEKHLPPDHWCIARTMGQLAHAVSSQNRMAEAERLYRGAVDIAERTLGAESDIFIDYFASYGMLLVKLHRPAEAEPMLRRALAISEKIHGPTHPKYAHILVGLGELLIMIGQKTEGEAIVAQASRIVASAPQATSARDQLSASMLRAMALREKGDFVGAETMTRDAIAQWETQRLPRDSEFAKLLNNLGLILQETDRLTESERYHRQALEMDVQALGPQHNQVGDDLLNIASLFQRRGLPEEALPLMRQALEIYEVSYGKEHPRVVVALNNLAYVLHTVRRFDEAESLQRRAVRVSEKCFGPESEDVAIRLNFLSLLMEQTQRFSEAEPILRRTLVLASKAPKPDFANEVAARYGACLQAMGRSAAEIGARVEAVRRGQPVADF